MIRWLTAQDAQDAFNLYQTLAPNAADPAHFQTILNHPGSQVAGAEQDGTIVAMATLHLLPNMSQHGRPYGLIENVVTLASHRNQGLMRQVFAYLHDHAWAQNAYKIMLLTGQDNDAYTFYQKIGYAADQKHGLQIRQVPPRDGMAGGAS